MRGVGMHLPMDNIKLNIIYHLAYEAFRGHRPLRFTVTDTCTNTCIPRYCTTAFSLERLVFSRAAATAQTQQEQYLLHAFSHGESTQTVDTALPGTYRWPSGSRPGLLNPYSIKSDFCSNFLTDVRQSGGLFKCPPGHRTGPHSRKVQANLPCWRPCRYHICAGKEAHRRHFLVVKTVKKEYFWCVLAVCQGTARFQLVDTVRLHVRTAPFSGCTGTIVKVHRLSECNSNSRRRIAIITHLNWIQPVMLPVKVF